MVLKTFEYYGCFNQFKLFANCLINFWLFKYIKKYKLSRDSGGHFTGKFPAAGLFNRAKIHLQTFFFSGSNF